MPTSQKNQINEILDVIMHIKPISVLDIGIGFGKYGFLCREYLELWDNNAKYGEWKHKIDGIEVYEDYITPVHNEIYDSIYVGNALSVVPQLIESKERYEMILLIDTLEHFERKDGINLLQMCKELANYVLISVPKDIGNQGEEFGNEFETHRHQFTNEWEEIWDDCACIKNRDSYIYLCGSNVKGMKKQLRRKNYSNALNFIGLLDFARKCQRVLD